MAGSGPAMTNKGVGMESETGKRKPGIPTGNAGEYLVMGEFLRRGWDAQLADRNTKGYDILVNKPEDRVFHRIQVKTVRQQPWYVNVSDFKNELLDQTTVYVLLGSEKADKPVRFFVAKTVRFFVAKNRDLADCVKVPKWKAPGNKSGFMSLKDLERIKCENRWDIALN